MVNNYIFSSGGFPDDFSILSVFRTSGRSRGELFTVYSADGNLLLSVKIARRIVLIYKVNHNVNQNQTLC